MDNVGTVVVVVVVVVVVGTTDAGEIVVGTEFLFTTGTTVVVDARVASVAGTEDAIVIDEFGVAFVATSSVTAGATTVVVGATVGGTTIVGVVVLGIGIGTATVIVDDV